MSDSELVQDYELKKRRKPKGSSYVWKYFTKQDKPGRAACNVCSAVLNFQGSTSNLKRHFINKHKDIPSEFTNSLASDISENFQIEYEIDDNNPHHEFTSPMTPIIIKKSKPLNISTAFSLSKKSKHPGQTSNIEMIQEAIGILSNVASKNVYMDNDNDELSQFGKFVTDQLRQLPTLSALQLQEKIYCLITRERINQASKSASFVQQHHCVNEQLNSESSSPVKTSSEEIVTLIEECKSIEAE